MGSSCRANPEQVLLLVRNYFEAEAAKLIALRMTVAHAEQRVVDSQYQTDKGRVGDQDDGRQRRYQQPTTN